MYKFLKGLFILWVVFSFAYPFLGFGEILLHKLIVFSLELGIVSPLAVVASKPVEFYKLPVLLFLVFTITAHIILGGIEKHKYSKKVWKSGEYVWLSLAAVSLLDFTSKLKLISKINTPDTVKNYEEYQNELLKLSEQIKTSVIPQTMTIPSEIGKTIFDVTNSALDNIPQGQFIDVVYYPFLIALALSVKVTMTSAEVFEWYKESKLK